MNVYTLPGPPVDRSEILRYAGCRKETAEYLPLEECLSLVTGQLTYRVVCEEFDISPAADGVRLNHVFFPSRDLAHSLSGCSRVLLFAATIGLAMDRLITRYERVSPVYAWLLHAIGSERIESLCGAFCRLQDERLSLFSERLRPRFSPGYGDLSLDCQQPIFQMLECEKRIGLTLTKSLLMSPSKSVTALAGIEKNAYAARPVLNNCSACGKDNCVFRSAP